MLENSKPCVIAEIGCNHMGDMEIAKEMIRTAAQFCNVNYVKFQKRNPRELLSENEYYAPHPNPENSYGKTYGEHREYLEFTLKQHRDLYEYCRELSVRYACSVWDITSAKEIVSLEPDFIKIPSACNLNFEILGYVADNFQGEIHISFGMTTVREEKEIIEFLRQKKRIQDTIIYSCVSGYPVRFDDLSLLDIKRIIEAYGDEVKGVGFSGHHLGIAADIAALAIGAKYFERHFTLDRTWKGTDHSASLEPDGLRKLTRDLNNVSIALKYKEKEILEVELPQRKKLKRI
jgi:sialic acid synthase